MLRTPQKRHLLTAWVQSPAKARCTASPLLKLLKLLKLLETLEKSPRFCEM
jgi:hypothetical protein